MKKAITLMILMLLGITILMADIPKQVKNYKGILLNVPEEQLKSMTTSKDNVNPPPPIYEFVDEPQSIVHSYYDYMPGNYCAHPIKFQNAHNGNYNGLYFIFHGQPGSTANNRRVYYGYVYPDGTIDYGLITSYDRWQGYPGVGIHPASGDAIASWHEDYIPGGFNETVLTYDDFDLMEIPGFWQDPLCIPQPDTGTDEYIWPEIHVGPSPIDGHVRIYLNTKNAQYYMFEGEDSPLEDHRLMYIDVPEDEYTYGDMLEILNLDNWSEPIYIFTDWRESGIRAYASFTPSWDEPGKVVYMGYAGYLMDEPSGSEPVAPGFYVWESYDYGETWDYTNLHSCPIHTSDPNIVYKIENIPQLEIEEGVIPDSLHVWPMWPGSVAGHRSVLYDSEGTLHLPTPLWIVYSVPGEDTFYHWNGCFFFEAEVIYKADGSWEIRHVPKMPGTDPATGYSVPWTHPDTIYSWLTLSTSNIYDLGFHENLQHQAVNKENDWLVQVWADGTKMLDAELGEGDPAYLGHPIIYISTSINNGRTWSDPIELTDIYSEEFDFSDQITVYPYIAPQIVDLGGGWGQIYMYYFNDYDYGATPIDPPVGPQTGGEITYMSLKINFFSGIGDEPEVGLPELVVSNYPNPFANSTTISFTLPNNVRDAEVKIYNTRGQLVRTLTPSQASEPTQWEAMWDGKDREGSSVASGIYFYKVESSLGTGSGKMLLMR